MDSAEKCTKKDLHLFIMTITAAFSREGISNRSSFFCRIGGKEKELVLPIDAGLFENETYGFLSVILVSSSRSDASFQVACRASCRAEQRATWFNGEPERDVCHEYGGKLWAVTFASASVCAWL